MLDKKENNEQLEMFEKTKAEYKMKKSDPSVFENVIEFSNCRSQPVHGFLQSSLFDDWFDIKDFITLHFYGAVLEYYKYLLPKSFPDPFFGLID